MVAGLGYGGEPEAGDEKEALASAARIRENLDEPDRDLQQAFIRVAGSLAKGHNTCGRIACQDNRYPRHAGGGTG
jgi:hypothetical protein